ncbi:Uncharacterized protein Rs2_25077 [Raphanus sativus]|nr:Uncharacterized protein Rs2_25077 [Raphanus sativus]
MGENFDIEELISYGDDLINLLNTKKLKNQSKIVRRSSKLARRKQRKLIQMTRKNLSMYACVTKVIPEADVNDRTKISGYMVDGEKRIDKFQLETNKMTAYESCNSIWSIIINKQGNRQSTSSFV